MGEDWAGDGGSQAGDACAWSGCARSAGSVEAWGPPRRCAGVVLSSTVAGLHSPRHAMLIHIVLKQKGMHLFPLSLSCHSDAQDVDVRSCQVKTCPYIVCVHMDCSENVLPLTAVERFC